MSLLVSEQSTIPIVGLSPSVRFSSSYILTYKTSPHFHHKLLNMVDDSRLQFFLRVRIILLKTQELCYYSKYQRIATGSSTRKALNT